MLSRMLPSVGLAVALAAITSTAFGRDVTPPQNAPANARWDAATGQVTLEYHGSTILTASVRAKDADGNSLHVKSESKADTVDEKVEQTLTFAPVEEKEGTTLVLTGTGDLLWAYNKAPEFFKKINKTPGETLRKWDLAAREELGPDVYILACWGVHPSLNVIGLVDGCRLGSDGFGTAESQRFNSWGGGVFQNRRWHWHIWGCPTTASTWYSSSGPRRSWASGTPCPWQRPAICITGPSTGRPSGRLRRRRSMDRGAEWWFHGWWATA